MYCSLFMLFFEWSGVYSSNKTQWHENDYIFNVFALSSETALYIVENSKGTESMKSSYAFPSKAFQCLSFIGVHIQYLFCVGYLQDIWPSCCFSSSFTCLQLCAATSVAGVKSFLSHQVTCVRRCKWPICRALYRWKIFSEKKRKGFHLSDKDTLSGA